MGAVSTLKRTPKTLQNNPVIFAGVFVLIIVGAIGSIVQTLNTVGVLAFTAVFFLVTPFFSAGVISLIERSFTADASLSTILSKGREYYVTLLVATIFQGLLFGILGAIVGIVGVFAGIFAVAGLGPVGVGVVITGIILLVIFVPFFFLQFFDLAVVVSDTSALDSFKRSYSIVRNNVRSVLGFSILVNLIGAITAIPSNWLLFGSPTTVEELQNTLVQAGVSVPADGLLPYVIFFVVVGTVIRAVTLTYRVHFYTSIDHEQTEAA